VSHRKFFSLSASLCWLMLGLLLGERSIGASAQPVILTLSDQIAVNPVIAAELKALKGFFEAKSYDKCLNAAPKAAKKAKSLEPWILTQELECAEKLSVSKVNSERVNQVLLKMDLKTTYLSFGPWSQELRKAWARTLVTALEMDQKHNRQRAWKRVETLSTLINMTPTGKQVLDETTRAKVWRIAGELLFLGQKSEGAREFFRRSLLEQEQPDLRERLKALESGDKKSPGTNADEAKSEAKAIEPEKIAAGSAEEIELFDRISQNLKSGDLVAASDDAVKLINDFPGSSRAKWAADRTYESLVSVAEKSGEKFLPVRSSLLASMEKADPDRVAEWARLAFNRGLWSESARLGKTAAEKQSSSRATKTLELAMDASIAIDDFKHAKQFGEELVARHAGTPSSRLAGLRLGLLAYREKDYSKSAAIFEKMIATQAVDNYELQSRYWLWRSLEKLQNPRAKAEAEEVARRFPFSYYGLRARLEAQGGKLDWAKENPKALDALKTKLEHRLWLTQEEKLSLDRAMLLVSAGWFEEAQAELGILPEPVTPDEKAIRAKIWAAAKNFLAASKLANEAWDVKFELRRPELMKAVWPQEHKEFFESAAKLKNLDPVLTRSLTKQESGYFPKAVSSSNALGLMQMIPPTAREIADDLKMGKINFPEDLFDPSRNITMGTHYVAKMLNQFKGHVPLALAAYNAGPTRVDRWLKSRPSLVGLETGRTSDPEFEIWIDEFPFAETSFYVKAILRNVLLYQIVESGSVEAQEPLWKGISGTPRPSSSPEKR
jgi:soluble lytic murein transglycosylase